jgi:hypothetical protein
MQDVKSTLEKLWNAPLEIDQTINFIRSKAGNQDQMMLLYYNSLDDIRKLQENLDLCDKAIQRRLTQLENIDKEADFYLIEAENQKKQIQSQCEWIEKEVIIQFCKNLVIETIFNVEFNALQAEEIEIAKNKGTYVSLYNQVDDSINNFINLKNNLAFEIQNKFKNPINAINPIKNSINYKENKKIIIKSPSKKQEYIKEYIKLRNTPKKPNPLQTP